MHVTDLPERSQDYLKKIFDLQEWSGGGVSLSVLASHMDQRPSTASEAIKRLATQGLVDHAPYGDIELSEAGRRIALTMVRRHRLIETFLCNHLGYGLDEVHDEAEVLEHAVSDTFVDRIASLLNNPTRDPHGDPIPDEGGHIPASSAFLLSDAHTGEQLIVDRISDRDAALVRYLTEHGVLPGVHITVGERVFADMAELHITESETRVQLPASSLSAVLVSAADKNSQSGHTEKPKMA